MERNPSPLETITALYLGKIVSYQEEIMKMLSEIMAHDKGRDENEIYKKHLMEARKNTSTYINDFLNRYRVELGNHPQ